MYNARLFTVVSPGVPLFMGVDKYESKCLQFTLFYWYVVALIRHWKARRIFHSTDQNRHVQQRWLAESAQSWNNFFNKTQIRPNLDLSNLPDPFLAKLCLKIKFRHFDRICCPRSKPIPPADGTGIIISHPEIDHLKTMNDGLASIN
jgi:hypothetical protein